MNAHRGREKLAITAPEAANREFKGRGIKYHNFEEIANAMREIGWAPELVRKVRSDPMNKTLHRLMEYPKPRQVYENFAFIFAKRLSEETRVFPNWELCAGLISKYLLNKWAAITEYNQLLAKICAWGIKSPLCLSCLTKKNPTNCA